MPGVDGFELLKAVPAAQMPLTVFVTAYDQYALKAFEANALDYLLKPVEDARLDSALDRVRHELSTRDADEHRGRLLRLLGTMSGRPDLTLDEALADADRAGGRPADDRLAIKDSGRILRVHATRPVDAAPLRAGDAEDARPGDARIGTDRHPYVATGKGWLMLREVQWEGKPRVAGPDFVNGLQPAEREGLRFE